MKWLLNLSNNMYKIEKKNIEEGEFYIKLYITYSFIIINVIIIGNRIMCH